MQHAKEWGVSAAGALATTGLDAGGSSHWVVFSVGGLTIVYTALKIWLVCIEIAERKQRTKNEPQR
jgi:hypothetical protein